MKLAPAPDVAPRNGTRDRHRRVWVVIAAIEVVVGFDAVMKQYAFIASRLRDIPSKLIRIGFINGLPGFVSLEADGELQTTALEIEDGKIAGIYVVRNPDKLRHLH